MFRCLPLRTVIETLSDNPDTTYLDGSVMQDFMRTCLALKGAPEMVKLIKQYFDSDTYVDEEGVPLVGYSTWRRRLAIFGVDFALVPVVESDPVDFIEKFSAEMPETEDSVELTVFSYAGTLDEAKVWPHTIHFSQTSDDILGALKSSQRNEVSKCLAAHSDKVLCKSTTLPDELLHTQYAHWLYSPKDEGAPDPEHATYMIMLWVFSRVCALHGRGQILSAYDSSGDWMFSCALNRIKGYFQFASYAQHPDHRQPRSGSFMLYHALQHLHAEFGSSKVFLTCPAFGMDDAYEGYKKQLSSGKDVLPSLFASRVEAGAPYLYIPTMEWVPC